MFYWGTLPLRHLPGLSAPWQTKLHSGAGWTPPSRPEREKLLLVWGKILPICKWVKHLSSEAIEHLGVIKMETSGWPAVVSRETRGRWPRRTAMCSAVTSPNPHLQSWVDNDRSYWWCFGGNGSERTCYHLATSQQFQEKRTHNKNERAIEQNKWNTLNTLCFVPTL